MSKDRAFPPVLIIEDERNIATLVAQYLTNAGFDPIVAYDGEVGLEIVRHSPAVHVHLVASRP